MSCKSGAVCAVYACNNYKKQKESKSFFRMPKNMESLKKWIIACKRWDLDELLKVQEPEYFNNTFVVCSDHFEIQCFRNKNLFSQGLFPGSVPTLNLFNFEDRCKKMRIDVKAERCGIEAAVESETNPGVLVGDKIDDLQVGDKIDDLQVGDKIDDLQQEIAKLKLLIIAYRRKLRNKTSLLSKYRKRNLLLRQELRSKSGKSNVPNFTSEKTKVCNQFVRTQLRLANRHKTGRFTEVLVQGSPDLNHLI